MLFLAERFKGVMALADRLEELGSMEAPAQNVKAELERLTRDRDKILAELNRQAVIEANAEARQIREKARVDAAEIRGKAMADAAATDLEAREQRDRIIADAKQRAEELADNFTKAREHLVKSGALG